MTPKQSLTATNLAVYQHLSCDLYIHNVYNGTGNPIHNSGTSSPSELSKAQFKRGLDWESTLYSWLDRSNLLLKVPSIPLEASTLLENILADDRKHFFIAGLSFWPPKHALKRKFRTMGSEPLTFGLAKPDLLEIKRTGVGIQWRVIDAKASKHVKPSHHVQIYFYTLCLSHLLCQSPYQRSDSAGVWLPPHEGFDVASPTVDDIKSISMSLLAPPLDALLFRDLPRVIDSPFDKVKWHYNPLCRGCRFEIDCKTRAINQGELGRMPNISIDDARVMKDLLRISRVNGSFNASDKPLTDIEELHELVQDHAKLEKLAKSTPTVVKKAKQILSLPNKRRVHQEVESPVIEAARTSRIQVIPRRNYTCPSREGFAVIISIVDDPSSPSSNGNYFCVTTHPKDRTFQIPSISCSAPDIVSNLANLIRILEDQSKSHGTTTQFYVWSSGEQTLLQTHVINAALTSSASNEDVRICIGALAQGATLLQTAFQPLLLSGALLTFLGKSKRTKAEYKVCLERMGLPTDGTVEVLRKRIDYEIQRLQEHSSTVGYHHERRKELGQLPRVVVLKKEIERQLALPIPGYWDLPECVAILVKKFRSQDLACPTDEQIFAAYKGLGADDRENLQHLLTRRNKMIYTVLKQLRKRAVLRPSGMSLLVNEAKILSTQFMDICKEFHIRKLFFMQQFEVLAKLTELWQSRIDSCPESPTLEYCGFSQGRNGIEYTFRLLSGSVDVPSSDKEYAFYDKLLVEDTGDEPEGGDNLPAEVLFDDLGVSGLLFPLNRYTKSYWDKQDTRVQQEILVADVRNVCMDRNRQNTMVSLRTWGRLTLKEGAVYRLSPRLVDFNTTKVLSALFEIDLTWESEKEYYGDEGEEAHYGVPFLQLIIDPTSFGAISAAKQFAKTENDIQKLFRDLKNLGNQTAGSLVLKASQHKATLRILSNRLSVIWGPPGTGKTYTISLSLLRLIEVERRQYGPRRKIVFITAITHAAIEACRSKLLRLMNAYHNIESLPKKWLDDVNVEIVTKGNDHPPPPKGGTSVHIYAGTIYQLYNFSKKNRMDVDCVTIDEAGQISLGSLSLVLRCLTLEGRIIIAGDSEQLAPILSAQYPLLKTHALFGSVLDCLMFSKSSALLKDKTISPQSSIGDEFELATSSQGTIVQLTENFRLNPDLGEFVSTIYSRQFKPQKVQARQLAAALATLADEDEDERIIGVQSNVLEPVKTFLVALSDVMHKQPQTVLVAPEVHSITPANLLTGTSDVSLTHRPVSLALINLNCWSTRTQQIGYEMHVHGEAAVAAALVMSLHKCCPDDNIFVATPHRIQREAVKAALSRIRLTNNKAQDPIEEIFSRLNIDDNDLSHSKIIVDTIERLQGSEAAFVICLFSLPKTYTTDLGFLLERRRLNVAISRAKTLCILISSEEVLCPSVKVLANEDTAKGYAFLKAYEKRAWSYTLPVNVDSIV